MREHQIVITLKPEQFLEVQKLARKAGAKSMGVFVRQHLLAALGIEGKKDTVEELDLLPALNDLKRLHGELKEFVAESLSSYSVLFTLDQSSDEISVELSPDLPFEVEDPGALRAVPETKSLAVENQMLDPATLSEPKLDSLEELAERTFAISPRLGASFNGEDDNSAQDPENDGTDGRKESKNARPVVFASETSGAEESKNTGHVFAPAYGFDRTGPGDEPEYKRDPLAELLEGSDIAQSVRSNQLDSDFDEDDAYDVPLSILARRKELALKNQNLEKNSDEKTQKPEEETLAKSAGGAVSPANEDKFDLKKDEKVSEEALRKPEEKPQTQAGKVGTKPFAEYNPLENLDEDNRFSGGPPPKRHQ